MNVDITRSRWAGLALSMLLMAGCSESDACADPVASPCAAPDPLAAGPFEVGVTTWELEDESRLDEAMAPRRLRVEVWYPATADAADLPRDEYDMLAEAPPDILARLEGVEVVGLPQNAARDATVDLSGAPYPVVIFSHGNGGLRFQNLSLMTHLASHGFVVVAPDHTDDTLWDALAGSLGADTILISFGERVLDLPFVAEAVVETDGPLAGAADPERWAIMGHSFGGSISLALTEQRAGVEPDARIRVAVPMTPSSTILPLFGYGVTRSRVPTLLFAAQRDSTIDYESEQLAGYERLPVDKILAAVREAGHFSYTDLCRPELEGLATALGEEVGDILSDGCGPDFIDAATMLDIQRWLITSFLHGHLRDSAPAMSALAPEALPPRLAAELDYRVSMLPE